MTIELPEHLRSGPLAEAAAKALQDAASMASASNSVPRISLKGRVFRLVEGGEEVAQFADQLDVIICGVEPDQGRMIKTFYENGYTQGANQPPTCSSENGITPDSWVQNKQAQTCASCPKNVFGSATSKATGKATKACRDGKRIWVKLAPGNTAKGAAGKPFEVGPFADRPLYGVNVTVASLKAFAEHGRTLAALGQGPQVCVTRMKMVDAEFPQLEFEIISWLDADTAPQSLKLGVEKPWRIKYAAAGLALANGDGSSNRSALPSSLPGLPAHLQQSQQVDMTTQAPTAAPAPSPTGGEVVGDTTKVVSNKDIDDAVGNW